MLNATIQLDVNKIISINIFCQHKTKTLDTTGRPIIKEDWWKYMKIRKRLSRMHRMICCHFHHN